MVKSRKKIEPGVVISDWDEAAVLGGKLVEITQQIAAEEATYNEEEQRRRAELTQRHAPLRAQAAEIELGLERFCAINKAAFDDKRSRDLQHIVVSFRKHPPKVKQISGVKTNFIIELILASKWSEKFIVTTQNISKEAVLIAYKPDADADDAEAINDDELRKLGLEVVQDESFAWTPKLALEGT